MRGWLLTVALVLVAGCADPAPLTPGEPTFSDAALPPMPEARLEWRSLAGGALGIGPASELVASFHAPEGTRQLFANLTLSAGAAYGLSATLASCSWSREAAFVAGQTVVVDCLGDAAGPQEARVATTTGWLDGAYEIVAAVCVVEPGARGSC